MKINIASCDENAKLQDNIILRKQAEQQSTAAITSEILTKLNMPVEALPQKCQHLLQQVVDNQSGLHIDQLDSMTLSLRHSREESEKLKEEYEILKLKQKNAELQAKIDRNKKFLEDLRKELACSKDLMSSQNPNPDNIQDYIRQLKHKVASYEESCEKAKVNFSKLSVPDSILPMSLASLVSTRESLRLDAETLRQRADDIAFVRQARCAFGSLRK
ncbi:uncharacterized protein [Epargyreus clarus]|uniref:uncharacterized protein n=1 Tax=Epargyreus clarus TaxID=520877 RepID=UPI003C2D5474